MKRVTSLLIFVVSAAITYAALAWMLGYLPKIDGRLLATVAMVHLIVHELGHWVVMEGNGLKSSVIFLVILGGAGPWPEYRKAQKQLSWHRQTWITMAGVMGNILVCLGSILLWQADLISLYTMQLTLNVGGSLIVYNLLPVWIFDGGRFAKYLFDSVSEDRDRKYQLGLTLAVIAILLFVATLWVQTYFFITWMVIYGLHAASKNDDPAGSRDRKAMTRPQQAGWAVTYVAIMLIGFIMLASTTQYVLPKP